MRRIQAPDVEINEFDRSQYGKVDKSLPNAPICLVTGFADKGEDYNINWIDNINTLQDSYGFPTNEAERYFYNAQLEILNRGGVCLAAKLPYFNKSKDHYTYTSYTIDKNIKNFGKIDFDFIYKLSRIIINVKYFTTEQEQKRRIAEYNEDQELSVKFAFIDEKLEAEVYQPDIDLTDDDIAKIFKTDVTDFLALDSDEEDVEIKKSVLDFFNRYDLHPKYIEDLFDYINDKCSFSYEAKRIFKHLFYDENGNCKNESIYILKALLEQQSNEIIDELGLNDNIDDLQKQYAEQIESMIQSFNNVEELKSFDILIKSFFLEKQYAYFIDVLEDLRKQANEKVDDEMDFACINLYIDNCLKHIKQLENTYTEITQIDSSVSSYLQIYSNPLSDSMMLDFDQFDDFKTGISMPEKNQFYIVDITRSRYGKSDILSSEESFVKQKVFKDQEFLGLVPVIITPANALYFQGQLNNYTVDLSTYNPVCDLQTRDSNDKNQIVIGKQIRIDEKVNYTYPLSSSEQYDGSLSEVASKLFPYIGTRSDGYLERDHLKDIGVVLFKAYKDTANNDKIGFTLIECFIGSLDRNAEDPITHNNRFIGNIINNSSKYINFFSNVNINDKEDDFDTYLIKNQTVTSLGFYENECVKNISYKESIDKPLNIVLDHANNSYSIPLDLIIDAGVSNIAQFIRSVYWSTGYGKYNFYDLDNLNSLSRVSNSNISAWKNIIQKFDRFVKVVRKDCMFLADGLRHFALLGNEKRVRRSAPAANMANDVLPYLKFMNVVDSSYSAGYCDWFWQPDAYSGDLMWMPPTIKAVGVYIYTDTYFNPWDAPAGLTRGVFDGIYDVAFNPNQEEAGKIYNQQWNYAISYPMDGIVQEGQKTFQKNKTALDRVNVRRLMLWLEKQVVNIGRRYLYEGNTAYLRSRFVDAVEMVFDRCQEDNGIIDYAIKCDDENNTPETIDRNELHIKIAVKPVKTLEFLVCDFIVTNQSANVNEEVLY